MRILCAGPLPGEIEPLGYGAAGNGIEPFLPAQFSEASGIKAPLNRGRDRHHLMGQGQNRGENPRRILVRHDAGHHDQALSGIIGQRVGERPGTVGIVGAVQQHPRGAGQEFHPAGPTGRIDARP